MEHGRSVSWDMLNDLLDDKVSYHASKWGCVWNRDILKLIHESGLKIDSIHNYHFGTTYLIVASPGTVTSHGVTSVDPRNDVEESSLTSNDGVVAQVNITANQLINTKKSSNSDNNNSDSVSNNNSDNSDTRGNVIKYCEEAAAAIVLRFAMPAQCNCERCSNARGLK